MHWIYGSEENWRDGKFEEQHYLDLPEYPGNNMGNCEKEGMINDLVRYIRFVGS
jgi:hypothetical protein